MKELLVTRLVEDLGSRGWSYVDGFFPDKLCHDLCANIIEKRRQGELREARVGRRLKAKRREKIRGDLIDWIDPLNPDPVEHHMLEELLWLGTNLSRAMLMTFNAFESHYACYPAETFYRKHLDVFKADDSRFLSVVLYLNEQWQNEHGGKLRIYSERDPNVIETEVEPLFGRLVVFLSRNIYHEVLPTTHPRRSVTGWFRRIYVQDNPLGVLL